MITSNLTMYEKGDPLPYLVFFEILMYVVSSSVLVVNGGIVVIFLVQHLRRPSSCPISPAGLLVLNLLISDAFVGALGIWMTATYVKGLADTPYPCVTRIAMRFLFRMGSHIALINVAVDRYIAILHTLRYREWVTMERSLAMIGLGWLVPTAGVVYAYLANDWTPGLTICPQIRSWSVFLTYVRLPSHIMALVCVVVIQCRIYLQLKHYEHANAPMVLRRYSHKSARSLFWVTTTYIVCWLPFNAMLLVILFNHEPSLKIMFDGTVILAHSSFLVNTFIFSYKTENIRKPVSEFCSDLWKTLNCKASSSDAKRAAGASVIGGVIGGLRQGSMDTSASNTTASSSMSSQRKAAGWTTNVAPVVVHL